LRNSFAATSGAAMMTITTEGASASAEPPRTSRRAPNARPRNGRRSGRARSGRKRCALAGIAGSEQARPASAAITGPPKIQPDTLHADTQGQSEPVFGLCRLLGIKLMPRMRGT
jgi:Tn3 transposase DDE domain